VGSKGNAGGGRPQFVLVLALLLVLDQTVGRGEQRLEHRKKELEGGLEVWRADESARIEDEFE
jgi:hypothetical protein